MKALANIPLIERATSPTISSPFINNQCDGCTIQVTGTFESVTVKIQGIVDPESEEWNDLASLNYSNLALGAGNEGITKKGIYQVGIDGISKVRAVVSDVSGGYVSVYASFTASE